MSIVAIITARGGSKRIPSKNIKEFCGKPMLEYAIDACKKSGLFDEIMVSTDSDVIASVAIKCGVEVPFMRSAKNSDDYATTYDVISEVIDEYEKRGTVFDNICCIYPCVPFLTADILRKAYDQFCLSDANALQPICKYNVPIEWAMRMRDGFLDAYDKNKQLMRSQDIEPSYYDVGMFYFCKTSVLRQEKTLLPSLSQGYIIDDLYCQDIDTVDDWKIAEFKYAYLKSMRKI